MLRWWRSVSVHIPDRTNGSVIPISVRDVIKNLEDQSHQRYVPLYLTQELTLEDVGDKGPLSIYNIATRHPGIRIGGSPGDPMGSKTLGSKSGDSRVTV